MTPRTGSSVIGRGDVLMNAPPPLTSRHMTTISRERLLDAQEGEVTIDA